MTRRWIRRIAVVAALVVVALILRWTVLRPDPVPVTVFVVAEGRVEETVTNSKAGTVRTRRRAELSPEVGGRVATLPVREGDAVGAGDVVLRLADEDQRAQLELAQRSVEAAEAGRRERCRTAEQARKDLERYNRLARDEIVSQELLEQVQSRRDTSESACEGARARVLEARAGLDLARVALAKTVLRAPFGGVVAEIHAEVGEWITPSPPGIMIPAVVEILDHRAIYVSVPLDEVDVGRVRVGQTVRITLDAFPDREFMGTVNRVAPYVLDIEEQNRTFEIEAEFDDDAFATSLLPGTSADVEIILDSRDGALRVPSYALIEGGQVLVFDDDDVLRTREVRAGLSNWQFTEIVEGLEVGTRVVVSLDRVEVQDGAIARISGETLK